MGSIEEVVLRSGMDRQSLVLSLCELCRIHGIMDDHFTPLYFFFHRSSVDI